MSDWETDPVVLLEKAVNPASWVGLNILCRLTPTSCATDFTDDFRAIKTAEDILRTGGRQHLEKANVRVNGVDLRQCENAADLLKSMLQALEDIPKICNDPDSIHAIAETIRLEVQPAIEASLDIFRRTFIGMIIEVQRTHTKQAHDAISTLDQISKQIYYIAINAAVEAARLGDNGAGFTQISADIRALSKDAQSTTSKLSSLSRA